MAKGMQMNAIPRKPVAFEGAPKMAVYALASGVFLAPYTFFDRWGMRWPVASAALLILIFLCPTPAQEEFGIRWRPKSLIRYALLFGVTFVACRILITAIVLVNGWNFLPAYQYSWLTQAYPFFQAANEEILMRGLLLGFLTRRFPKTKTMSLITSVLFCLGHYLFYGYAFRAVFPPEAVLTLFCFSLIANQLYFYHGHIGYGLLIHASWNLTRFGGILFDGRGSLVSEVDTFRAFEGARATVAAVILLLAASTLYIKRRNHRRTNPRKDERRTRSLLSQGHYV